MIALKYQETDTHGSFTALGTGFLYEYSGRLKTLYISHAGSFEPLLQLGLDGLPAQDAFEYVRLFEKTTQIEALKFSNNATTNIARTLDDTRLPPILQSVFRLSLYAFYLEREQFDAFAQAFLADHELKRIEIRKMEGHASAPFYLANLETKRASFVSVRSSTLHGAMAYLSEKIMQDIISREFSYHVDSWVHKLLNTASVLSILSYVLNRRFDPARKPETSVSALLSRIPTITKSSVDSKS
jgi:hypothetical protein